MNASSPEVEWVLEQFASVANDSPEPLTRVDRDAARSYEAGKMIDMDAGSRRLTEELRDTNVVGATLADRAVEPIGTEYDHRIETIIGVRVLAHGGDFGHVAPAADLRFDTLVANLRDAAAAGRSFPAVGRDDVSYHTAFVEDDASQSGDFQDRFRYDFDVRFVGYEDLP